MKKRYSYLLIISIFALNFFEGLSLEEEGNCILYDNGNEISDESWKNGVVLQPINDTTPNEVDILRYEMKNIYIFSIEFVLYSAHDKYYVDKYPYNSELFIRTVKFHEYEIYETNTNLTMNVKFTCNNSFDRNLTIVQPIIDTNNHDPKFSNESYNYNLTMPLEAGFNFTALEPIVVRDIDLTNENITFTLINSNETSDDLSQLKIWTVGRNESDKKNFIANFITENMVYFEEDTTFILYATDSGNPPRTVNTSINIFVDKPNSAPRFDRELYTADLRSCDYRETGNIPLRFTEGDIKLTHGYAGDNKFELKGLVDEYKKYFELKQTNDIDNTIKIDLQLVNVTKKFWKRKQDIVISLEVVKNNTVGSTELHIRLPGFSNNIEYNDVKHSDWIGIVFCIFTVVVICHLTYTIVNNNKKKSFLQ